MTAHVPLHEEACQEKSVNAGGPLYDTCDRGRLRNGPARRQAWINLFEGPAKKRNATACVTILVAFLLALDGNARSNALLKFVQTISLPGVQGRVDHIAVDVTVSGFIAVYSQKGANDYTTMGKIVSETDPQPSLCVPQFDRLYFPVTALTPWNDRATTLDLYSQAIDAAKLEAQEDNALAIKSTAVAAD
jgi:hypothetical protein